MFVRRYRYRTAALTGPWRDSPGDALRDAVKAKQAVIDEADPADVRWIVPGRIEEQSSEGVETRRLRS